METKQWNSLERDAACSPVTEFREYRISIFVQFSFLTLLLLVASNVLNDKLVLVSKNLNDPTSLDWVIAFLLLWRFIELEVISRLHSWFPSSYSVWFTSLYNITFHRYQPKKWEFYRFIQDRNRNRYFSFRFKCDLQRSFEIRNNIPDILNANGNAN